MSVTWLFDIGTGISTDHYGMEPYTYGVTDYAAKIIPESFTGIAMRVDLTSKLYAPNTTEFNVSNADGLLGESDFQDRKCCIGVLLDGVLLRSWTFIIETATEAYGEIHCVCVDPIKRKLEGDFPNTPSLAAAFPSDQVTEDADYKVPITFGTAFIPCMPFLVSGVNYYCLGRASIGSYTIEKVRSPRSWDFTTEWDNSYTYTQSDKTGEGVNVRATQMTIADSDGDGTVDSNGIWVKSGTILPPLIKFLGPYPTTTNPGEFIYQVLQLFGVGTSYLNSVSFITVDAVLAGVVWGGGWWKAESKESILSNLLSSCDCFLSMGGEMKLHQFSKTPVETLARSKIKQLTFTPSKLTKQSVDGATLHFVWDGEPQDELTGEVTVPLYGAQTTIENPSSETLEYKFGYDNSEAQKFGILWAQKNFDQKYSVTFETVLTQLTTRATIVPGQVITIYGISETGVKLYGDSKDVVITSIHIKSDLDMDCEGTVYNHLEEYADLSPSEIIPDSSSDSDFNFLSLSKIVSVSGINIFHYDAGASVPAPTSVTLTATLFGGLTSYDWEYWVSGDTWANLSGTQNQSTYVLAYNNAAWGGESGAVSLRVRCLSGDYYGEITVTKVHDGEQGEPGDPGEVGASGPGVIYIGEYGVSFSWPKVFYNNSLRRDIIKYSGTYYLYNYTNGYNETSWVSGHWETFGATFSSVATDILLAQDVAITRSLSFSGGASYLNVIGADGLIINASGGLKVVAGADIYLVPASGNTSQIKWSTATSYMSFGVDYDANILGIFANAADAGSVRIGWIPADTGGGWIGQDRKLSSFYVYTAGRLYLSQISASGTTLIDQDDGEIYLGATEDITIQCDAFLPRTGYTIPIGSLTNKFSYGYFTYDLSCRALILTSSITGTTTISTSGAITCGGAIQSTGLTTASATADLGTAANPFRYTIVGSRMRFYYSGTYRDILPTAVSSGGTTGAGYWPVEINGVTRYIRLNSTT